MRMTAALNTSDRSSYTFDDSCSGDEYHSVPMLVERLLCACAVRRDDGVVDVDCDDDELMVVVIGRERVRVSG